MSKWGWYNGYFSVFPFPSHPFIGQQSSIPKSRLGHAYSENESTLTTVIVKQKLSYAEDRFKLYTVIGRNR